MNRLPVFCFLLGAGCFPVVPGGPSGNGDGDNGNHNGGNGNGIPIVTLSVSNSTPTLNEEVILRCEVTNGISDNLTFAFQPLSGRLVVDEQGGTARFVVSEPDLNIAFDFTCTAESALGISEPSDPVTVTPSDTSQP